MSINTADDNIVNNYFIMFLFILANKYNMSNNCLKQSTKFLINAPLQIHQDNSLEITFCKIHEKESI